MMIKEDFIAFLTSGRLTHFPYGMEKVSVIKMLGEPEEEIEDDESSMIKYDRTEFYFYKGDKDSNCLAGILIQPIPEAAARRNLDMDYGWLDKTLDYNQSIRHLLEEGILFTESSTGRQAQHKIIITTGAVTFYFFESPNRINKIGRFMPMEEFEKLSTL
jgi:hypothetical protein